MSKQFSFVWVLVILLLVSCKKDPVDKEAPIISSFSLPSDSSVISNNVFTIEATLNDNEELTQCKVIIKPTSGAFYTSDTLALPYWNFSRVYDVDGSITNITETISIPDTIASAWYNILLSTVDASGNLSRTDTNVVFIRNTADSIPPILTLQWPADLQFISKTGSLHITSDASDNQELSTVVWRIFEGSTQVHSETKYLSTNPESFEFDFSLSGLTNGLYTFELTLYDRMLNSSQQQRNFVVID
jgi:hypothetical protein